MNNAFEVGLHNLQLFEERQIRENNMTPRMKDYIDNRRIFLQKKWDESTKTLSLQNDKKKDKKSRKDRGAKTGTDKDVELL